MPKYIIERNITSAGSLTTADLQAISQKSCGILNQMGPRVQWLESFVTDDKVYCVYIAPDETAIRAHAEQGAESRVQELAQNRYPRTCGTRRVSC